MAANIKLFKINGHTEEIKSIDYEFEKELQIQIEDNMQSLFGVSFLKTEYKTTNGGRMDSIGIDDDNSPVIFEYKRSQNENVINQGLFYLDWLLNNKDSFKLLVMENLGEERANKIDWTSPSVICIAGDFNKYDESAINQIARNISLIRYKRFGNDLLMFEKVGEHSTDNKSDYKQENDNVFDKDFANSNEKIQSLYENIGDYISSLGDVFVRKTKFYVAFRKMKTFIQVRVNKMVVLNLDLKIDENPIAEEKGFTRNISDLQYWGTIEVTIKSIEDFEKAKQLIERAYKEK